jgi:hypothetical protein
MWVSVPSRNIRIVGYAEGRTTGVDNVPMCDNQKMLSCWICLQSALDNSSNTDIKEFFEPGKKKRRRGGHVSQCPFQADNSGEPRSPQYLNLETYSAGAADGSQTSFLSPTVAAASSTDMWSNVKIREYSFPLWRKSRAIAAVDSLRRSLTSILATSNSRATIAAVSRHLRILRSDQGRMIACERARACVCVCVCDNN